MLLAVLTSIVIEPINAPCTARKKVNNFTKIAIRLGSVVAARRYGARLTNATKQQLKAATARQVKLPLLDVNATLVP